jgi:hypothetical protein
MNVRKMKMVWHLFCFLAAVCFVVVNGQGPCLHFDISTSPTSAVGDVAVNGNISPENNWDPPPYTSFATSLQNSSTFYIYLSPGGQVSSVPFTITGMMARADTDYAKCTPTFKLSSSEATSAGPRANLTITTTCLLPGQSTIVFSVNPSGGYLPIQVLYTKSNGNALNIGSKTGGSDVVKLGVTNPMYDANDPTYIADAYELESNFFVELGAGALHAKSNYELLSSGAVETSCEALFSNVSLTGCAGLVTGTVMAATRVLDSIPLTMKVVYGCKVHPLSLEAENVPNEAPLCFQVNGPVKLTIRINTAPYLPVAFSIKKICGA